MDLQHALTSQAVVLEISTQIRNYRISRKMTQKDLADQSGVSLRSISRFEQGADIQLSSLVKILRSLGLLNNLEMLVPDVTKSPSYYLTSTTKKRVRNRKTTNREPFKWGDEL